MESCERVLHVLHSMNCGGAENLIMSIYRNIDRTKLQFDFIVNFFGDMYFQKEIEALGGRIYRMKSLLQLTPPLYKKTLYRFIVSHPEHRIIHSHLETTTGIILSCANKAGIKVRIAHSHNTRYPREGIVFAPENAYKEYCRKKILPNASALFACSNAAADWLFREKSHNAVIVKNGIDTEKFRFDKDTRIKVGEKIGISEETTVLTHVGRFYDQKNHIFLIDIFYAYKKVNNDAVLLLVGEGPLKKTIKERVSTKGLDDSVLFLGLREDVNRILQRTDYFLLPSKFEGLPLVLVEAQCAGVDCFVSKTVSCEADLGCGLMKFLPIDSPEAWVREIQNTHVLRQDMSRRVEERGYDIKSTTRLLEGIYVEMLAHTQ
jgi:glycosyltransferase involved in cell wall biosynthesis